MVLPNTVMTTIILIKHLKWILPSNYIILKCGEIYGINKWNEGMFYLRTHSAHFIYGYMASDIWQRTIQIVRDETRCRHMDYSFRLTRVLLYAPSHRQDNIYHGLCYTSRGTLAGINKCRRYIECLLFEDKSEITNTCLITIQNCYTSFEQTVRNNPLRWLSCYVITRSLHPLLSH